MFKAEVAHESELKGISVRDVALKYDIEHSMVVRWRKKKIQIYEDAAETHRRNLKKGRRAKKYPELHVELYNQFIEARRKGHRVDFNWLWSKARVIQREKTGDESCKLGKHVVVQFLHKYKIRMRVKQRNKAKSKESYRSSLQKWHASEKGSFVHRGVVITMRSGEHSSLTKD